MSDMSNAIQWEKTQGCIHAQVESYLPIGVQTFTQLKPTARLLQNC